MDQHELLCKLKDLAIELGRSPTRKEFIDYGGKGSFGYESYWPSFTLFLLAAGLTPKPRQRKIDNSIFERNLENHLQNYEPRVVVEEKPYPRIACLPDLHMPFENQRVIDKFYRFIESHQPEYVVQMGDLYDAYSHSKFPRSHNVFTPREEQELGRKKAETLWSEIKKLCPNAKLTQCAGNHDVRALKRVLELYPAAEDWVVRAITDLMTFPGVDLILDPRQELMIHEIAILHGFLGRPGSHKDYLNISCITAHTHLGSVTYRHKANDRIIFELNCGYAADPESKGLSYTSTRMTNWTPGFGFVDEYGPRFINC